MLTPEDFAAQLHTLVIARSDDHYRRYLNTPTSSGSDPLFRELAILFQSLSEEDQETLVKLAHQVTVDTVAHTLSIIDGAAYFSPERPSFKLSTDTDGRPLNGDLHNLILKIEEAGR